MSEFYSLETIGGAIIPRLPAICRNYSIPGGRRPILTPASRSATRSKGNVSVPPWRG